MGFICGSWISNTRARLAVAQLGRVTMGAALTIALLTAGQPNAWAVQKCGAAQNNRTGVVTVSARGVGANPRWGFTANAIETTFFNEGACLIIDRLRKCNLGDPATDAGRLIPAGCTIYLEDDGTDPVCAAFITGCIPQPRTAGGDGVVQFNQGRAQSGGVTPGDAPGFPVTITQSGSYRLTSNLDVRAEAVPENVVAVEILADSVTVDLNGYAIIGSTVCSGTPVTSCAPTGTGRGIYSFGSEEITVLNGTVRGMGSDGMFLNGNGIIVREVHVRSNGNEGIRTGTSCVLVENSASLNGSNGIRGSDTCVISRNAARDNGDNGFRCGSACTISHNAAFRNGGDGLETSQSGTVIGNVLRSNFGFGLRIGAMIKSCV